MGYGPKCAIVVVVVVVVVQGGLYPEVRPGDDMVISPFKLSTDGCGLIRLQIEFQLDRWVIHNNKMLYHQEISK